MEKELFVAPEELGAFFKDALCDLNNVFVFSTDVVKNSWAEWCVSHPAESGVDVVLMERFIAWDKFKGEVVRGKEADKASIPSILRKFFVSSLISENAASPDGKTIFKKIINPIFRKDSASFADWISDTLRSLKLWNDTVSSLPDYKFDDEDDDYLALYKRYSDFLNTNNFFEPSWVEPDFSATGRHYVIFYPELLEDYSDYIDIFKKCPDITVVSLPKNELAAGKIPCIKYSDSRKELRRTILQIRKLCADGVANTEKVRWDEVVLNVPDLPTYRPYLERELTKYCVPYVIKAGSPLVQNSAAQVFTEIQNCFNSEFSYESMRSLILDEYIPWKSDKKVLRENLIIEGNKMRCICGFNEGSVHFDSWEEALSATSGTNSRELEFYRELKHDISAICNAKSFDSIVQAWVIFKGKYLEEDGFSKTANDILGRCITELKELAKIENEYCQGENSNLSVSNHYDFFITELSKKIYTPQSKNTGISVYPYKTSAGAYFSHQFVIDANQKNLEVQYKKLGFLNEEKRVALGLVAHDKDFNVSKSFIRLYAADFQNSEDEKVVHFSYAENSFAGFAICHNALKQEDARNSALDDEDFILQEKAYLMGKDISLPLKLSKVQKEQLEKFQIFNKPETENENENENPQSETSSLVLEKVKFTLIENRNKKIDEKERDGKIVITQSDMKDFFPCPRKWIFSKVLSLEEETLDTDLMKTYDMGTINHKILELVSNDEATVEQFAILCNDFLNFFNDNKVDDLFENSKCKWLEKWKDILGNTNKNESPYSLLAELLVLKYLLKEGKNVFLSNQGTHDIESEKINYEVKSTIERYSNEVHINSQYQMVPNNGKELKLVFVRLERSQSGYCIRDVINSLIGLGYDKKQLDKKIENFPTSSLNEIYKVLETKIFTINDNFPRITANSFKDNKIPVGIKKIEYIVDLTDIENEKIDLN